MLCVRWQPRNTIKKKFLKYNTKETEKKRERNEIREKDNPQEEDYYLT